MSNEPIANHRAAGGTIADALRRRLETSLGRPVRLAQTHISWVLLDGTHAWKIKKPVRLGFLDFSDLETRRRFCEEELRLNRRLAADLYLDVVAVRGTPDAPRLDGSGEPIEYAVRMVQFPDGALLVERLAAGALQANHLALFARRLVKFQRSAARAPADSDYGSGARVHADVHKALDGISANVQAASEQPTDGDDAWIDAMRERMAAWHRHLAGVFEARRAGGWVREGHGDLHLSNVVVLGDEVTAFDCIEFDPGLRWIDVQNDAAFLYMDLLAHGRDDLAAGFLDDWLAESGDYEGLAVLPYYATYRALVRALVTAIRSRQGLAGQASGCGAQAPDHAALARRLAEARDPRLMITCGLAGSGKSFVSRQVLERTGAVRLRSDVERKRLFGLHALEASMAGLDQGIYAAAASTRTYDRLLELAGVSLDAGFPTIVDAAFLRADDRARFRAFAEARALPFTILHCRAAAPLLRERVRQRLARGGDPSEAGPEVLERQLAGHDVLRADEGRYVIDVDSSVAPDAGSIAKRWLGTSATR